jgi:zinc protease
MIIFKKHFILACVLSFSLTANALEDIPDIKYEKFTLPNGLRVLVHEDHKIPVVAVNVWYHVGSKDEEPGKTGFAHLFEHLMFNGTENYNDEYFGPFQQVGATDMNGTTNNDRTNYFENVPTPALELALWMESDRMGHLLGVVDQDKLDNQTGVVQNEKRQGENRPYGKVFLQAAEATFPEGHPYSWTTIGSMEDLSAATLEDVQKWFKTYYGPNNAVIALAGDIDLATAKELVSKYFGDIPAGPSPIKKKKWVAKRSGQKREIMYDRVPNTRIYKTWNTAEIGTQDHAQLELIASLLSGGKNSYLYQKLVYEEQLATGVEAFYYGREIAGQFWIYADLANGRSLEELEQGINQVVQDFIKRGPNSKRLNNAKTSLQASWIKGLQRVGGFGGKSDILANGEVYLGDPHAYKTLLQIILDSTAMDLKNTAKKWLSDGEYILTVMPEQGSSLIETKVDRTQLPYPDNFPQLDLPDIQRATLSNGLEVVLAERHDVPMINLSLQMKNGHATDPIDQSGLASFSMSMLTEGTKKYDALELSEQLEELGTDLYTSTGLDSSSINLSTLKSNFIKSLKIFNEVITEPAFEETEIERKKFRWLAALDQSLLNPTGIASYVIPGILYGENHPYAKPFNGDGTKESISWGITREDLVNYQKSYINPSNATLIVVGDTTLQDLLPKLESELGDWKDDVFYSDSALDYSLKTTSSERKVYLIDKPGAIQSLIVAGQLLPGMGTEDEIDIGFMNAVMGGSFTARINMNLREDKGWSYGARSRLSSYKGPRPMLVSAPVQTDKTIQSIEEIIREYNEYLSDRPAEETELEKIIKGRALALIGEFETFGALMSGLANIVKFNRPDDFLETLPQKYRSIEVVDVNATAQEYLRPKEWTWVIIGDLSQIEQGIRDLNLGYTEVLTLD